MHKYTTALEHSKEENYTVARDPGGVGEETANGGRLQQFIKSTLDPPSSQYNILTKEHSNRIEPSPLIISLVPKKDQASGLPVIPCKSGNVFLLSCLGSILSDLQKLSEEYVISDFLCTTFPILPLDDAIDRFELNIAICPTPFSLSKSFILKYLSVISESVGSSKSKIPLCLVISLSEMDPVYNEEINETAPCGVIPINPFNVVLHFQLEYSYDWSNSDVGVCTKISVQSRITLLVG